MSPAPGGKGISIFPCHPFVRSGLSAVRIRRLAQICRKVGRSYRYDLPAEVCYVIRNEHPRGSGHDPEARQNCRRRG